MKEENKKNLNYLHRDIKRDIGYMKKRGGVLLKKHLDSKMSFWKLKL